MMDLGWDPRDGISFCIGLIVTMVVAHGSMNNYTRAIARRELVVAGCPIISGLSLESEELRSLEFSISVVFSA